MKISVVTPVLNDARVARALDSVLAQRHEHELELIVIDGGSTDGTLDVLEAYRDRITVFTSEADGGIYHGMNKGIGKATGDVVAILNADDRYRDPLVIRDVMEVFADPEVGACCGDVVQTNRAGRTIRHIRAGRIRKGRWHSGWMPPHPAFFLRRRVYEEFGAFDVRLRIAADYELLLRLLYRHAINALPLHRVLVDMAPGGFSNRSPAIILEAAFEVVRAWQYNGLGRVNGCLAAMLKLARKPPQFIAPPFQRLVRGTSPSA